MFNATLAGHHLRADYNNSRGGSRAASRFDINEVGRCQGVHSSQLEERISMLHLQNSEEAEGTDKTCYSRYKTCCYLSLVFSIIAATIVIIIYVALGGLRGGGM